MGTSPTPIAPLLLHTCKRYTYLPAIDSTAPPPGGATKKKTDVYATIDLVATALTCEHLSYYDAYPSVVKGMFQQRIYRSLGLSAHLGWARLVINRTKTHIRHPAEDDASENGSFANPDRASAFKQAKLAAKKDARKAAAAAQPAPNGGATGGRPAVE